MNSVHKQPKNMRKDERGNVLFLILIAVALFAALSYAVMQNRSGGDASNENNLISSATITQYPAAVSAAIVRMVIGGVTTEELRFNRPNEYNDLTNSTVGVFHPRGGGAAVVFASPDVMKNGQQGEWFFNAELQVPDIGTSGINGNDLIAYLPGLKQAICKKINERIGIADGTVPRLASNREILYRQRMVQGNLDYTFPVVDQPYIDDDGDHTNIGPFNGQPFGCFQNNGGGDEFVYYHVLVER